MACRGRTSSSRSRVAGPKPSRRERQAAHRFDAVERHAGDVFVPAPGRAWGRSARAPASRAACSSAPSFPRVEISKASLDELQKTSEGTRMLVPITSSLYVPGETTSLQSVLIDVGTGYYIEKSVGAQRRHRPPLRRDSRRLSMPHRRPLRFRAHHPTPQRPSPPPAPPSAHPADGRTLRRGAGVP